MFKPGQKIFCVRKSGVLNYIVVPCTCIKYYAFSDKYKIRFRDKTITLLSASRIFETEKAANDYVTVLFDKQVSDSVKWSAIIEEKL